MSFVSELRRRNVFKVSAVYIVSAWALIQVADIVLPTFGTPEWVAKTTTLILILGFPVAVILAWAFELTPQGIEKTRKVPLEDSISRLTGQKINFVIIGVLALALIIAVLDKFVPSAADPLAGLVDVSQPVPGFSNRAAIAVLPFVNMSDDPAQEYFSDGITEDIITGLQSIGSFPIISRTSTFAYKGQATDVREVAKALGAGYVLEGSVRKIGNQVRITAQLIDANGVHIWAEFYDSELTDIFSVQDEIRHQIIGAIEPELLAVEMDRAQKVRTEDMQAWDYYLQAAADATTFGGYADRNRRPVTLERTKRAKALALKAVELDPNFADGYTLLGHISFTYVTALRGKITEEASQKALQEALEYTRRGRELSPFGASACSCYVYLLAWTGKPEAGLKIQQDAVRLNPANAVAHAIIAKLYQILGQYDEALREIRIAKRLSPRDSSLSFFLSIEAATYLSLGDWQRAVNIAEDAIQLTPLNYDAHVAHILALYAQGKRGTAVSAMHKLAGHFPELSMDMLWDEQLSSPLMAAVSPLLESDENIRYRQAVTTVLTELGWNN